LLRPPTRQDRVARFPCISTEKKKKKKKKSPGLSLSMLAALVEKADMEAIALTSNNQRQYVEQRRRRIPKGR
jgi:hypothetical protein